LAERLKPKPERPTTVQCATSPPFTKTKARSNAQAGLVHYNGNAQRAFPCSMCTASAGRNPAEALLSSPKTENRPHHTAGFAIGSPRTPPITGLASDQIRPSVLCPSYLSSDMRLSARIMKDYARSALTLPTCLMRLPSSSGTTNRGQCQSPPIGLRFADYQSLYDQNAG